MLFQHSETKLESYLDINLHAISTLSIREEISCGPGLSWDSRVVTPWRALLWFGKCDNGNSTTSKHITLQAFQLLHGTGQRDSAGTRSFIVGPWFSWESVSGERMVVNLNVFAAEENWIIPLRCQKGKSIVTQISQWEDAEEDVHEMLFLWNIHWRWKHMILWNSRSKHFWKKK